MSAAAATLTVPAGGDLQATLNAAQPGDTVLLQSGALYVGNFNLPSKPGADWIVVRTDAANGSLPPAGVRMTPEFSPLLAKLRSPTSESALTTAPGAHHWRFECVEFLANVAGRGDIIKLGAGDATQTQTSQMPHDLVFDRVYVHGDPVLGQKRGIALNSGLTQIINSYFSDIKAVGQDSQAIAGWNGSGPYLIENNYVEAAAENVLFGGADPAIWNLVPSDITVRRNVFTKPLSWRQEPWVVKNAFELKNARRVLIEGNVFEHVWRGGQPGYAVLFTVRNQDGKAPWSVIEDVTFRYNIIREAGAAINILGFDNNYPSAQTRRLRISHNLIYGIDASRWGGNGDFIQMGAMPRDIYIDHNTVLHTGNALHLYTGKTPTGRWQIDGVVFRDNVLRHNDYGVKGESAPVGNGSLAKFMPDALFDHNVLAGGPAAKYPAGNYFPSIAEFEAQFVDIARDNFTLVPGSPFGSAATDGGALGADIAAIQRAQTGVAAPPPPSTSRPGTPTSNDPAEGSSSTLRRPFQRPPG
jgi:hypothetical protein